MVKFNHDIFLNPAYSVGQSFAFLVQMMQNNINAHYKNNAKLAHLNVILISKADEIKDLLDQAKFDVLFINESKLDSLVYNSLVSHAQYWIVRGDRKKGAGALLKSLKSPKDEGIAGSLHAERFTRVTAISMRVYVYFNSRSLVRNFSNCRSIHE